MSAEVWFQESWHSVWKAGHLEATYFCRRNDGARNDPRYLLGTVAHEPCDCNSQYKGGVKMFLYFRQLQTWCIGPLNIIITRTIQRVFSLWPENISHYWRTRRDRVPVQEIFPWSHNALLSTSSRMAFVLYHQSPRGFGANQTENVQPLC